MFDSSTKLLFPIKSTEQLAEPDNLTIHPTMDREQAKRVMDGAIDRMSKWQEGKNSRKPFLISSLFVIRSGGQKIGD